MATVHTGRLYRGTAGGTSTADVLTGTAVVVNTSMPPIARVQKSFGMP
jgi:hypothetical protein